MWPRTRPGAAWAWRAGQPAFVTRPHTPDQLPRDRPRAAAHRRGQHPYPTHAGECPAACPARTHRRRNRTGARYPIPPSTSCWLVSGPVDLQAQPNQFRGVDSAGLRPHPSHVCIHRRNSDAEFSTDLRVGESVGEVREHILFPRGQLRELCQVPPLRACLRPGFRSVSRVQAPPGKAAGRSDTG